MANDLTVEQSFRLKYQDEARLAGQQLSSKLRPFVTEKTCSGLAESASDIIENDGDYEEGTAKERSNSENPAEFSRRWLVWRNEIKSGQYIDKEDTLRRTASAQSQLMRHHMSKVKRGVDDTILGMRNGVVGVGGLLGSVSEGQTPSGSSALPAAQTMAHGSVGLTMAKMMAVREQFALDDYDLDEMDPVMAISPKQMTDLLGIVDAASTSINAADQAQLREGKVTRFMRLNFIEINRLPLVGTTRSNVAWMPDNIVLGIWEDVQGDIWEDTHAGNTPYMKNWARMDATRIEDKGVIEVECTEA